MHDFLKLLRDKYGGAEKYVQEHCKLTKDEIEVIKKNLVEEVADEQVKKGKKRLKRMRDLLKGASRDPTKTCNLM